MKITLLALLFALPAAAQPASHSPSPTLDQLQECAAGHCWDSKGQQVTVPPQGALFLKEPQRIQSSWERRPKEPPRYTVFTKEEVHSMRQKQAVIGSAIGAGCGAMLGFLIGGLPGAVIGGLIAGAAAYFLTRPKS